MWFRPNWKKKTIIISLIRYKDKQFMINKRDIYLLNIYLTVCYA